MRSKCHRCTESFSHPQELADHWTHKHGFSPVWCEPCNRPFATQHGLNHHVAESGKHKRDEWPPQGAKATAARPARQGRSRSPVKVAVRSTVVKRESTKPDSAWVSPVYTEPTKPRPRYIKPLPGEKHVLSPSSRGIELFYQKKETFCRPNEPLKFPDAVRDRLALSSGDLFWTAQVAADGSRNIHPPASLQGNILHEQVLAPSILAGNQIEHMGNTWSIPPFERWKELHQKLLSFCHTILVLLDNQYTLRPRGAEEYAQFKRCSRCHGNAAQLLICGPS